MQPIESLGKTLCGKTYLLNTGESVITARQEHLRVLSTKLVLPDIPEVDGQPVELGEHADDMVEVVGVVTLDKSDRGVDIILESVEDIEDSDRTAVSLRFDEDSLKRFQATYHRPLRLFTGQVLRVRGHRVPARSIGLFTPYDQVNVTTARDSAPVKLPAVTPSTATGEPLRYLLFSGPFHERIKGDTELIKTYSGLKYVQARLRQEEKRAQTGSAVDVVVFTGPFLLSDDDVIFSLSCSVDFWYAMFFAFIQVWATALPNTQFIILPGPDDSIEEAYSWPNGGFGASAARMNEDIKAVIEGTDGAKACPDDPAPSWWADAQKALLKGKAHARGQTLQIAAMENVHLLGAPAEIAMNGVNTTISTAPIDYLANMYYPSPQLPDEPAAAYKCCVEMAAQTVLGQRHLQPSAPPSIGADSSYDQSCWIPRAPHIFIVPGDESTQSVVDGVVVISVGRSKATYSPRWVEVEVDLTNIDVDDEGRPVGIPEGTGVSDRVTCQMIQPRR